MTAETYLSPRELAELLKVPIRSVYQWNSRGTGPPYSTIGRHIRYRLTDIEDWLADQQHNIAALSGGR